MSEPMTLSEPTEAALRDLWWHDLHKAMAHLGKIVAPDHLTAADLEAVLNYVCGIPPEEWSERALKCRPLTAPPPL